MIQGRKRPVPHVRSELELAHPWQFRQAGISERQSGAVLRPELCRHPHTAAAQRLDDVVVRDALVDHEWRRIQVAIFGK